MPQPKRFKRVTDGEWIQPVKRNHYMKCCDCGLVHRMNFRVVDGHVQFQAFRLVNKKRRRGSR